MLILSLLVASILLIPQLFVPWMLIDDGISLTIAKEYHARLTSFSDLSWLLKFEGENGMLRPVYWLFQWVRYLAFGDNHYLYHLGHLFLFLAIIVAIYKFTKALSNSSKSGFLASFLFIIFYPASENLYRLGPIEPLLTLFFVSILYYLYKAETENRNRYLIVVTFLTVLSYLAKTISLSLISVGFLMVIFNALFKQKKINSKIGIYFLSLNLVVFGIIRMTIRFLDLGGGYSSQYVLDSLIFSRFYKLLQLVWNSYSLILLLGLTYFGYILYKSYLKKSLNHKVKWQLILLGFFCGFIVIQSPWIFILGRYLHPAVAILVIVVGINFSNILNDSLTKLLSVSSYKRKFVFSLPLLIFISIVSINIYQICKMYSRILPGELQAEKVVKFIVNDIPPGSNVYYNLADIEYFFEIPLHLNLLYNRKDINHYLLKSSPTSNLRKNDYLITWVRSARYGSELTDKYLPNLELVNQIGTDWYFYKVTNNFSLNHSISSYNIPTFYYQDGDIPLTISNNLFKKPQSVITFFWQPPNSIKNIKDPLILLSDLNKNNLLEITSSGATFKSYNPWLSKWEQVIVDHQFSPENVYSLGVSWGPSGMWLSVDEKLKFNPYTSPLFQGQNISIDNANSIGKIEEFMINPVSNL